MLLPLAASLARQRARDQLTGESPDPRDFRDGRAFRDLQSPQRKPRRAPASFEAGQYLGECGSTSAQIEQRRCRVDATAAREVTAVLLEHRLVCLQTRARRDDVFDQTVDVLDYFIPKRFPGGFG